MKIKRPTLLINSQICKENIRRMAEKAKRNNVEFRPHFKTHQSLEVGRWFKDFGVDKITVSSVQMAGYFAKDGWSNITIAFPVNILEIDEINALAKSVQLNLLVESKKIVRFLEDELHSKVGIFIKIDAGYHRTGIPIENDDEIDALIACFSGCKKCRFMGFLVHNGHTYKSQSVDEIKKIHFESLPKLTRLKKRFIVDFPDLKLSMGDTPSMSIIENFEGIDEIRPGNFVFYDLMQSELDVCDEKDIAVVMACPVVAKHKNRNELVIYGGGVHLSKESIQINDKTVFGKIVLLNKNHTWNMPSKSFYITSLSQEHGIVQLDDAMIGQLKIGDLIGVFPTHSCLAANLQKQSFFIIL